MKRCLVDVNVWLALLVPRHQHYEIAARWYEKVEAGGACLCRFVQLALIRLLSNQTIMTGNALPARESWKAIEELLDDERVEFVGEPSDLDLVWPMLMTYPVPAVKLVGDSYLAAFALAASMSLTTFDRGFQQFRQLDVELLKIESL